MSRRTSAGRVGKTLTIWTPEDRDFWVREGQAIANLNLWISIPALFLAFAVWRIWSAVAGYGGFFIPKSYGTSIALTGGPQAALTVFVVFYLTCIALTWWYYVRRRAEMPC